ncbi:LysM peptidoglycan-binding domain-containing protein [uncultured Pseudokineococcus sp.]|uniref:LysM peptidoglycan-binding domain-containing protein n=1 Tax=uncultured Pseudokineococcus sp. TaxID=1642928 RepID=UPI00261D75BC|nr:LysM domain-containing protein [uncultured Pseudokineococcus sp.]
MPSTAVPQDPAPPAPPEESSRCGAGRGRALGVLAVAAVLGALGAGALVTALPALASASSPATTAEDLLVGLAAGAGGALAATWALAAALVALARLAPRAGAASALARVAQRLLPSVLRGLLVIALGAGPVAAAGPALAATPAVSVSSAVAGVPAGGDPAGGDPAAGAGATSPEHPTSVVAAASGTAEAPEGVPDVTWRPSPPPRPTSAAVDAAASLVVPQPRAADDGRERPGEVVVVRGDTLWDIARRALPAGADDAEVAAAWPAWHEANRSVVGDDPDHLLPGQRLVPPGRTAPAAGDLP